MNLKRNLILMGITLSLLLICLTVDVAAQCTQYCTTPCGLKARKVTISPQMQTNQLLENFKNKKFTGSVIDLSFKNVELSNLFAFFSKVSGLKFQLAEGLNGQITIDKQKVKWDEALHKLLEEQKLQLVQVPSGAETLKVTKAK